MSAELVPALPDDDPDGARLDLAAELVSIAAALVVAVHDEGPDAVAGILARVPTDTVETGGLELAVQRFDALAVILAGMVDPARTTGELLDWSLSGPVVTVGHPPILSGKRPREHGSHRGYVQHMTNGEPTCVECRAAERVYDNARRAA